VAINLRRAPEARCPSGAGDKGAGMGRPNCGLGWTRWACRPPASNILRWTKKRNAAVATRNTPIAIRKRKTATRLPHATRVRRRGQKTGSSILRSPNLAHQRIAISGMAASRTIDDDAHQIRNGTNLRSRGKRSRAMIFNSWRRYRLDSPWQNCCAAAAAAAGSIGDEQKSNTCMEV